MPDKRFTFRISSEMYQQIKTCAGLTGMSITDTTRFLVTMGLMQQGRLDKSQAETLWACRTESKLAAFNEERGTGYED